MTERRFRNYYKCPKDNTNWTDEWSCTCNDHCPACNIEIEPYFSEDIIVQEQPEKVTPLILDPFFEHKKKFPSIEL